MKAFSILLIEDDPDIHANLRLFLEQEGYTVNSAYNGREAMDYLFAQTKSKEKHILLLDLMMPIMDGYEFLKEFSPLKKLNKLEYIAVILLSAATDASKTASEHGLKFVKKPIDLDFLLQTIEEESKALV